MALDSILTQSPEGMFKFTNPTANQVPKYDDVLGKFVNGTVSGGGTGATTLNELDDVVVSSPSKNQVIVHNGTTFINGKVTDSVGFPNATWVFSASDYGSLQESHNIGAAAWAVATLNDNTTGRGIGFYGHGWSNGTASGSGVVGEGRVTNTSDSANVFGVRGYSNDTHSGGTNIGGHFDARNGAINYSVYLASGGIYSSSLVTAWNINADITFSSFDYGFKNLLISNYAEGVATPAISTNTLTLDLTTGNVFNVVHNANITTLTISNPPASGKAGSFTLILTQDATGTRTVTFPAAVKWSGGTAPTLTTTANKKNILTFFTVDAGTTWFGSQVGKDY